MSSCSLVPITHLFIIFREVKHFDIVLAWVHHKAFHLALLRFGVQSQSVLMGGYSVSKLIFQQDYL